MWNEVVEMPTDSRHFRRALGQFATGVTVITCVSKSDGRSVGMTVNSFASVSLDPPLVLWNLANSSANLAVIGAADGFAVNVLSKEQCDIAKTFAAPVSSRFNGVPHHVSARGLPVLDEAIAVFECRHHTQHVGGDHTIFIGEVMSFRMREAAPLVYSAGNFAAIHDQKLDA